MEPKKSFEKMLTDNGLPKEAIDHLWKWYDFTEKKGVASF
jgi:hypothetical protein